ncbi:MAG TPA: hypothetical protein VMM77_05715 [Gemmatimonadaceae bacterium]|nr:hypothetical protein [Gemmatimonadaceae bacterium]
MRTLLLAAVLITAGAGCRPRVVPLMGDVVTRPLPRTVAARTPQRLDIEWRFYDQDFSVRGDGVVRLVPPDSARLDFFLSGGYGGGRAILIGDSLDIPSERMLERLLPPPALLWATLGRLTVQGEDTIMRVNGDTLRADIGSSPRWRASFVDERLVRLDRIDGDRLREFVVRIDSASVLYEHSTPRRRLEMTITRRQPWMERNAEIWH